jgi:hypothetical protein
VNVKRIFVGKKVPLSSLSIAILMSLGAGQLWAGDSPVEFQAKLTARADEVCGYEIVQPSVTAATAIYTKGMNGSAGQVKIVDGEPMKFVIKAKGGTACSLHFTSIESTYRGAVPIGSGGVYGVLTKNGSGYYPVHWAIGGARLTDKVGAEVNGAIAWPNKTGYYSTTLPINSDLNHTQNDKFLDFAHAEGGKVLQFAWSGSIFGNTTEPATLRNGTRVDGINRISINANDGSKSTYLKAVEVAVVPMVGAAPYNLTTHEPDDTTVADGEELSATAILTVTAH